MSNPSCNHSSFICSNQYYINTKTNDYIDRTVLRKIMFILVVYIIVMPCSVTILFGKQRKSERTSLRVHAKRTETRFSWFLILIRQQNVRKCTYTTWICLNMSIYTSMYILYGNRFTCFVLYIKVFNRWDKFLKNHLKLYNDSLEDINILGFHLSLLHSINPQNLSHQFSNTLYTYTIIHISTLFVISNILLSLVCVF